VGKEKNKGYVVVVLMPLSIKGRGGKKE